MRVALLLLLAGLAAVSVAQADEPKAPAAAPAVNADAKVLANAFLDKMRIDQMMPQLLAGSRQNVITLLQTRGFSADKAAEVFDSFMLPEFKARLPELRDRMADILVADFTVAELQAIVSGEQNDARKSAAAKASQLQGQFTEAGRAWGQQAGIDVYQKNKAAFEKLGITDLNGAPK